MHGGNSMIAAATDSFDPFNDARAAFLAKVVEQRAGRRDDVGIVVVTHLLPDRPVFLDLLSRVANIEHVIGIPYSTDPAVLEWVGEHFTVSTPDLAALMSGTPVKAALEAVQSDNMLLFEIGGYGAGVVADVRAQHGARFLGVVEGTESGVARYRASGSQLFPIVAMPSSPVKTAESAMVGPACLASANRILRAAGMTNESRNALVLGFGRVGRSVAAALRDQSLNVDVYDIDPAKRLDAIAHGFRVPGRAQALSRADIIFAATGRRSWSLDDAVVTKSGAIFVSCSSKDVEFSLAALCSELSCSRPFSEITALETSHGTFYFIYNGNPVNFSDGANLGPILTLLQGEILCCIDDLIAGRFATGLQPPLASGRPGLIETWLESFISPSSGWYARTSFQRSASKGSM